MRTLLFWLTTLLHSFLRFLHLSIYLSYVHIYLILFRSIYLLKWDNLKNLISWQSLTYILTGKNYFLDLMAFFSYCHFEIDIAHVGKDGEISFNARIFHWRWGDIFIYKTCSYFLQIHWFLNYSYISQNGLLAFMFLVIISYQLYSSALSLSLSSSPLPLYLFIY